MSAIIIPRRHYTQPQGRVALSEQYAGEGVLTAWNAPQGNLIGPHNARPPYEHLKRATPQGVGYVKENNTTKPIFLDGDKIHAGNMASSYLLVFSALCASSSSWRRLWGVDVNGKFRVGYGLSEGFTLQIPMEVWNGGVVVWGGATSQIITGRAVNLVCLWDNQENGGFGRVWQNGVEVPRSHGGAHLGFSRLNHYGYTSSGSGFGFDDGGTPSTPNTLGCMAYISTNKASPEEAQALSANPYQIFRADPVRIYSLPPVLTIPTLSSPGVIDITASSARPRVTLAY